MHSCDYRKGTSGFIHGFRHNIYFLANILRQKLTQKAIDFEEIPNDVMYMSKKFMT